MRAVLLASLGALSIWIAYASTPETARAHIKMLKPTSWVVESEGLLGFGGGDPQKTAPCGPGALDNPTLTNAVTEFRAGETITVEWEETIPHPGWFRIALAQNRDDLKDPDVQIDSSCNVMPRSSIPTGAHGNVLADGLFLKDSYEVLHTPYSQQVTLPNTPCEKCTLQLIQFMEDHAPGCIYYHCADLKIVAGTGTTDAGAGDAGPVGMQDAGAGGSLDAGGQTGGTQGMPGGGTSSGTTGGGTSGTPAGGGAPGTAGGAGGTGGATAGGGASGGTAAGTAGGTTGAGTVAAGGIGGAIAGMTPAEGAASDDDGGCECSVSDASPHFGNLIGMGVIALGLLARRRRLRRE